jgi:hypothetical protein
MQVNKSNGPPRDVVATRNAASIIGGPTSREVWDKTAKRKGKNHD